MAIYQRRARDPLAVILIGGGADQDLGESLSMLMSTCIRQDARQFLGDQQTSVLS
jgi:hypothetical protein